MTVVTLDEKTYNHELNLLERERSERRINKIILKMINNKIL
jgi:hypothetical protein